MSTASARSTKPVGESGVTPLVIILGIMAVTVSLMLANNIGVSGPNPNVSGTEGSFNFEGEGTDVNLEDSALNTGRGAGSSGTDGKELPGGISGTSNSMNVKAGAKFKGKGLTFNAGADAGVGFPQKKERK